MGTQVHEPGGFAVPQPRGPPIWGVFTGSSRMDGEPFRYRQPFVRLPPARHHDMPIAGYPADAAAKRKMKQKNNQRKRRKIETEGTQAQQGQGQIQGSSQQEYPRLKDFRRVNRAKTKQFFPRSRPPRPSRPPQKRGFRGGLQHFHAGEQAASNSPFGRPHAPYNTSSFLMRSSKMGIHAPLESPVAPISATPAVPSPGLWQRTSTGDRDLRGNIEEMQLDPYGSMTGNIRLKSFDQHSVDEDEEVDKANPSRSRSSDSDESGDNSDGDHDSLQSFEHRMDEGLKRFEFHSTDPSKVGADGSKFDSEVASLRRRLEEQDIHIGHLEEENLTLRERLYILEQTLKEVQRGGGAAAEVGSGDSGDEVSGAPGRGPAAEGGLSHFDASEAADHGSSG